MGLTLKQYIIVNSNKLITLVFSALFVFSFFIFQGYSSMILYTGITLFLINLFNFFSSKKVSAFFEILIYESIALLGIYYINWFYVLVFVLVAEVVHLFRSRIILWTMIFSNSILYLSIFLIISSSGVDRGLYLWHVILLLFISIGLSIYFVNAEENYEDSEKKDTDSSVIEKKYNDLLIEHEDILFLKEIMDLSAQSMDTNKIIEKTYELLWKYFDDIDYTTIFLFDHTRKQFRIITSNVPIHFHKTLCNLDQFDDFDDVISEAHSKILSSEVGLTYPTAVERGIISSLCVPIHTHKDLTGLILIESQQLYAFKDIDLNKFNLVRYNISLVVESKLWIDRIERMALVDGLTGVYNRNFLFDFLDEQLKWHKENSKNLCLVLFDIDHFKKFNDTYGHLYGDLVLKETSRLVKDSIRDVDLVARYGGEEFIIVILDTDIEAAKERVEEIRLKIQSNIVRDEEGVEARVTVSFGIAEFNQNDYNITIKELIERADQALYNSKHEGRNRVSVYN